MSHPPLVAFGGVAGAGKSTAAAVLESQGFELVKFAGPLKAMMRAFYRECGLDPEMIERKIEGDLKEESCELLGNQTPRFAMQTLGTEWGRDTIFPDLWVNAWGAKVSKLRGQGVAVVTDDCRFENEAARLKSRGGTIVEIKGRDKGVDASHQSEQINIIPDFVVHNESSQEDFEAAILTCFGHDGTPATYREMTDQEFDDSLDAFAVDKPDPLDPVWDMRDLRGDVTAQDVQEAITAAYTLTKYAVTPVNLAFRHIEKHRLDEFTHHEMICLVFYVDCITAGLEPDFETWDDYLGERGVETPSLPL